MPWIDVRIRFTGGSKREVLIRSDKQERSIELQAGDPRLDETLSRLEVTLTGASGEFALVELPGTDGQKGEEIRCHFDRIHM